MVKRTKLLNSKYIPIMVGLTLMFVALSPSSHHVQTLPFILYYVYIYICIQGKLCILCIYAIYIYDIIMYTVYIYNIEYIIVNLQFHHVAPPGPHQAIGLRQIFPSCTSRQQLMQRRHDLRIAAALHGARRRPRDPELQAAGHRAAAVEATKPPGLLVPRCVESRSITKLPWDGGIFGGIAM